MSEAAISRDQLLQTALELEHGAESLYTGLADKFRNAFQRASVENPFSKLAEDERQHAEWYSKLLQEPGTEPAEADQKTAQSLIKKLEATGVIAPASTLRSRVLTSQIRDLKSAVELCQSEEQRAFMFYSVLVLSSSGHERDLITKIAETELEHYRLLSGINTSVL